MGDDAADDGREDHSRIGLERVGKLAARLLDDEQDRGEGRAKGGGETRGRACREQTPVLLRRQLQGLGGRLCDRTADVDGRSFSADHKAGTEREKSAEEFHQQDTQPANCPEAFHGSFDFLHTGATCLGREHPYEPHGHDHEHGGDPAGDQQIVRFGDAHVGPQQQRPLERAVDPQMQRRPQQAGEATDDDCDEVIHRFASAARSLFG